MGEINPHSFRRLLIIRLSSIGDVVLTTPVIRTLHKQYPDIKIDYLIKEQFKDLIAYHPALDTIRTIPKDFSFKQLVDLHKQLQSSGKYDFILDLHDNLRSRVLTLRGNLPYRRYNKHRFYRWLYVYWKIPTSAIEPYITDRYFEAARPLGISDDGEGLDFYFPDDFKFATSSLAAQAKSFGDAEQPITMAPGAAWPTKQWLPERFVEVGKHLIDNYHATIALLGGPAEQELSGQIRDGIDRPDSVLDFTGKTSLLETAKILEKSGLHIGNDSGLTHIATAFKTKVLVIFGSTARPLAFHPKYTQHFIAEDPELSCRPCTHMGRSECPLGHLRCMKNVQVEDVLNGVRQLGIA